ncbi:MAG: urease accessory protein [Candidatus Thiodiazotropha sp.]
MLELLAFGFFIGMSHALEPDHVAAVGAMTLKKGVSWKSLFNSGLHWGGGHTLMLLCICGVVIVMDLSLTGSVAAILEAGVGVMLIVMGINLLYRFRRQNLHLHVHAHDDGKRHAHFHGHATGDRGKIPHGKALHEHRHQPLRLLFVGLIHGAAGSASLLTLTVAITHSVTEALVYVAVFGFGSMLGMGLLTAAAAWPLALIERRWAGAFKFVSVCSGLVAVALGFSVLYGTLGVLGLSI